MERCPKDREVALKFFFGDVLTWDDIFDRHGGILIQNKEQTLPQIPQGDDVGRESIPPEDTPLHLERGRG